MEVRLPTLRLPTRSFLHRSPTPAMAVTAPPQAFLPPLATCCPTIWGFWGGATAEAERGGGGLRDETMVEISIKNMGHTNMRV
ncbi:hypothetical protein OROGR_025793 [Orobanche gracilis]